MYDFRYERPVDLASAADSARENEDAAFLSGGMTLLPTMKQRLTSPSVLVDLTRIPAMKGIDVIDGDCLRIGGCTTHAEVAASESVRAFCPALTTLAGGIGDPAVRHRGTIGGSVANNDPAADYPSAVLALNATLLTSRRKIPADEFFLGLFETALEEGEILTAIEFPKSVRAGYGKYPNPASRYAMAGVFIAVLSGGETRVAVTGAGSDGVFRWRAAEEALSSSWDEKILDRVPIDESALLSDMHAAADYRCALMRAMGKRALRAAG